VSKSYLTYIGCLCTNNRWVERAKAWDRKVATETAKKIIQEERDKRVKRRRQRLATGIQLQAVSLAVLKASKLLDVDERGDVKLSKEEARGLLNIVLPFLSCGLNLESNEEAALAEMEADFRREEAAEADPVTSITMDEGMSLVEEMNDLLDGKLEEIATVDD
jgi:hypothetical protein